MYNYKVGYWSCEESNRFEFQHESKFFQEELFVILVDVFSEIYPAIKENDSEEREKFSATFKDLIEDDSFLEAMGKRGFVQMHYDQDIRAFGWANAAEVGSWKSYADDLTKRFQEELSKMIFGEGRDGY